MTVDEFVKEVINHSSYAELSGFSPKSKV